jgi:hypothetical protein
MQGLILETCCICNRPLSHPTSVELGIGPICAKRHGVERNKTADENSAANVILARILRDGATETSLTELQGLGFPRLADAVAYGRADYRFETAESGDFAISFPYDPARVEVMRYLKRKGVRTYFDRDRKAWPVRAEDRPLTWKLLNDWYRTDGDRVMCWSDKGGVFFVGGES